MASQEQLKDEAERMLYIEEQEYNLVRLLKPRISIDGDQWSVVYGENLQDGVSGFGDTPYLAVIAFNRAWHHRVEPRS